MCFEEKFIKILRLLYIQFIEMGFAEILLICLFLKLHTVNLFILIFRKIEEKNFWKTKINKHLSAQCELCQLLCICINAITYTVVCVCCYMIYLL